MKQTDESIVQVPVSSLRSFPNHPFLLYLCGQNSPSFFGSKLEKIKGVGSRQHLEIDFVRGLVYHKNWIVVAFSKIEQEMYMEYLSLRQTAEKWGISIRRVQTLCSTDRIPGATKIGSYWAIPADAEKPKDERIRSGRYVKQETVQQ